MASVLQQLERIYIDSGHNDTCAWVRDWVSNKRPKHDDRWAEFVKWVDGHSTNVNSTFIKAFKQALQGAPNDLFPETWLEWFGANHILTKGNAIETSVSDLDGEIAKYSTAWGQHLLPNAIKGDVSLTTAIPSASRNVKQIIMILDNLANDDPVTCEISTGIQIKLSTGNSQISSERSETYKENAVVNLKNCIYNALAKWNNCRTTTHVDISLSDASASPSWWHIDYPFIAFCAGHSFFENRTSPKLGITIQMTGVPSIIITGVEETFNKQFDACIACHKSQPEHLFWWGKWNLSLQKSFSYHKNVHQFNSFFQESAQKEKFQSLVQTWLKTQSQTEIDENRVFDKEFTKSLLAKSDFLRVDLSETTRTIDKWLRNKRTQVENPDLEKVVTSLSIHYGSVTSNVKVKAFSTIRTTRTYNGIFGGKDGIPVKLWNNLAKHSCVFHESTLCLPERYCKTISPMTFYYIFKALALDNDPKRTITLEINVPEGDKNTTASVFKVLCDAGFRLFHSAHPTMTIRAKINICMLKKTTKAHKPLQRPATETSYGPTHALKLLALTSDFVSYLEHTVKSTITAQNLQILSPANKLVHLPQAPASSAGDYTGSLNYLNNSCFMDSVLQALLAPPCTTVSQALETTGNDTPPVTNLKMELKAIQNVIRNVDPNQSKTCQELRDIFTSFDLTPELKDFILGKTSDASDFLTFLFKQLGSFNITQTSTTFYTMDTERWEDLIDTETLLIKTPKSVKKGDPITNTDAYAVTVKGEDYLINATISLKEAFNNPKPNDAKFEQIETNEKGTYNRIYQATRYTLKQPFVVFYKPNEVSNTVIAEKAILADVNGANTELLLSSVVVYAPSENIREHYVAYYRLGQNWYYYNDINRTQRCKARRDLRPVTSS